MEVVKLLEKTIPRCGWEEWCEKDGVVCFSFMGKEALKIFFGNPKNLSVYHVVDFGYAKYAKDEKSAMSMDELAFTLVGSKIYVLGCGHREVTAPVYRCDLATDQLPTGDYQWEAGPQLKTHKHDPLVFNLAGDIYVLSVLGVGCRCERFEVLKKKGEDEWVSLKVPEGLSGGRDHKSCVGSCVYEQGKKILVLVVQRSNSALTLFTYDAGLDKWEDPRNVHSPDYTFPLDLKNNSFVINGSSWFPKDAVLEPLGLRNVLPLPEANRGETYPRFPGNWHLLPTGGKRFCFLLVHSFPIDDSKLGTVYKTYVQFGTFDFVEPQNHTSTSKSKPDQYKIDVKKIEFIDIAFGREVLLPYIIAPCTMVPAGGK